MRTVRVVAAVIVRDGRVLATQRGYGDLKDGWEFPGGKVEPGETPEQALVREIREELGATVEPEELVASVEHDHRDFHLAMDCYRCRLPQGEEVELREHEAARWLGPGELRKVAWLPADLKAVEQIERRGL